MSDPVTLAALGVAISKLLLRWTDLNDTADALDDAQAGFSALRSLRARKATNPVGEAIASLLKQRLVGVRNPARREEMTIAVANVADLFSSLSDDDIRAAAQNPEGFPAYLARRAGPTLLAHTEEAVTPLTEQLIIAGAEVFAQLAPRSGRFTAGALVRLLNQVDAAVGGITGLHDEIAQLLAAHDRVAEGVDALHPKVNALLEATRRPGSVVEASRQATLGAHVVGPPIGQWDPGPGGLNVHNSITVNNETSLTPYLSRHHDGALCQQLKEIEQSDRPILVLVVGTSCTGKTRAIYEAVRSILPDWQLIAPRDDRDLVRSLERGIPERAVVWLDELQDRIPATHDGIASAKAICELLEATSVGPILFVGTLWPTNLRTMQSRPDATQAAFGAGAIPLILSQAKVIEVPDCFTPKDLASASSLKDPRLTAAINTAAAVTYPQHGRQVTQVLAGGTQLVQRLYPRSGTQPANRFSPAAIAVLRAAGDLRRIGMSNPIPSWAIEGAAPGYLSPSTSRPSQHWLTNALHEVTEAAEQDDPLTGGQTHDVHHDGVAALTPHWSTTGDGGPALLGYDLHDYLSQDHLSRSRFQPTSEELWRVLESNADALGHQTRFALEQAAGARGLYSSAAHFARVAHINGDLSAQRRLARWLSYAGGRSAVDELRQLADAGVLDARDRLPWNLAARDTSRAVEELYSLVNLWGRTESLPEEAELEELRGIIDGTARGADQAMAELLGCLEFGEFQVSDRGETPRWWAFVKGWYPEPSEFERYLYYLDVEQDDENLDTYDSRERLSYLLARTPNPETLTELRARANSGDGAARHWYEVVRHLNWEAQDRLAFLLAMHPERARNPEDMEDWRIKLWNLAHSADAKSMERLCAFTESGFYEARRVLAYTFLDVGHPRALDHSRALASLIKWEQNLSTNSRPNWWLAVESSNEAEEELRVRSRSEDDPTAEIWLAWLLARRGLDSDIQDLRQQIDGENGWWLTERLAACLAIGGNQEALESLRSQALGGEAGAASWLVAAYRRRPGAQWVIGLDARGGPAY